MIRRLLLALTLVGAVASSSFAQVELKQGRVWLNGEPRETVFARSCFKLAAHVTYHFAGRGGGHYGLGSARAWVDEQIGLGFDGCRVLLETEGWSACESGAQANDGKPDSCMFGSEPRDQGFWEVEALRRGGRPTSMHGIGRQTLRWFFETSQETGFLFELVVIATLKHNDVSVAQQTHVVRQTLAEAYRLQQEFPQANILMNAINEWNAHSRWTLPEVNQLAVRADRWKHPDGRTAVGCSAPAGFEPEQWPCGPLIVDGGGGNTFDFDVGPEPGKFDMGAVHPTRDADWREFPTDAQVAQLVRDSRGQPWGITEYMYYVEPADEARARTWYRSGGWTTDCQGVIGVAERAAAKGAALVVVHDEKGVQSVVGWPRAETCVDRWAREFLGGVEPPPPPPPPPSTGAVADVSGPDERGIRYVQIEFPGWPRVVPGVRESDAVLEEHVLELPQSYTFYAGGSFIGLDGGDVGEFDLRVACDGGPMIYQRSLHLPRPDAYNAEDWEYAALIKCRRLRIWLGARTTGPNDILRRGQPWSSRPHFGGRLWTYPER